jgi:membrane protein implicated in regulation of membrane protease activity
VWAWILTIPAAALVAGVTYLITVSRFALLLVGLAAVAAVVNVAAGRWTARRGTPTEDPAGSLDRSEEQTTRRP